MNIKLPIKISKEHKKIIKNIPDKIENEIFVPIQGYESYYISNQGKIWSCKTNQYITGYKERNAYRLYLDAVKFALHILVAKHFIKNSKNKIDVIHLGNVDDNRACMLQWATRSESKAHIAEKSKNVSMINHEEIIKNIPNKKEGEIFVQITHKDFGIYNNYYISNKGNIWNSKTKYMSSGYKDSKSGYYRTSLSRDKLPPKNELIHRLVACHFIPNPEKKEEVNHLGEKHENSSDMLEWVTPTENKRHAANHKIKHHRKIIQKLDPDTLSIITTYNTISEIKGYTKTKINNAIKDKTIYNGFRWEPINVIVKNTKIIEGELWVSCDDSIYDELNKYPNYYVSNKGRVKNLDDRIMVINYSTGTARIAFSNGNKKTRKFFKLHRLILMAFNKENPENKETVDHIDSNHLNNCLENLRWADRKDQKENIATKKKLSLPRSEKCKQIRVTYNNITYIHNGLISLSEELKIHRNTISKHAKSGEEYKGYKFEILDRRID